MTHYFRRFIRALRATPHKPTPAAPPKDARLRQPAANDWAYDQYHSQVVIANRWQLAFWSQTGVSLLLVVGLITLLPLKTWDPIVVHRNTHTGEVWVENAHTHALPETTAEIESDLVRYVIARETYAVTDTLARYRQVIFTSSPAVAKAYRAAQPGQGSSLTGSTPTLFSENDTRTVKIQDIVFLEAGNTTRAQPHASRIQNTIAKIDFITTDTDFLTDKHTEKSWVATVQWAYVGTPDNKTVAWENWNGFMVTDYRVDQRNL